MASYRAPPPSYNAAATKNPIKLYKGSSERQEYEFMAELYSLIMTIQHLEKAFLRDAITAAVYEVECFKLIGKFKTTEASLIADSTIKSTDTFMRRFHMDCPAARQRIKEGVPSTVIHNIDHSQGASKDLAIVNNVTQLFITLLDALKLGHCAVDELQPLTADLCKGLGKPVMILGIVFSWTLLRLFAALSSPCE